ncbi:MAG: hypothetical protein OHK0029_23110 [Armatimonadaceae bacterium]
MRRALSVLQFSLLPPLVFGDSARSGEAKLKESPKSRVLLILLGVFVGVYLLSLPWQRQQWKALEEARQETRVQEARVAEVQRQRESAREGNAPLPVETDARIAALQEMANRGVTQKLLAELKALESAPLSPVERANLAGVYQSVEYWDRAYPLAKQAVEDAEKAGQPSPEAVLRLGYLEMLLGYAQTALPYFQRAAALAPGDAPPQVAIALAYDQASDWKAAEKALRTAIERDGQNPALYLLLAKNLSRQERLDEALAALDSAEKRAPTLPQVPFERGEILTAAAKRLPDRRTELLERADAAVSRCLTLDPNNVDARFLRGMVRLEQGAMNDARQEWEEVYRLKPTYPMIRYQLGQLYQRLGKREKGKELIGSFGQEKRQTDEYNRLVTSVGMATAKQEKRRELARWCAENGRLSRAILEYDQILAESPDDAEARRERDRLIAQRDAAIPSAPGMSPPPDSP